MIIETLDELERLVVQRLFELAKLGMLGIDIFIISCYAFDHLTLCKIGYKLRRQIGKTLQWHSEAIRTALGKYNAQAVKLTPPCPTLTWKEVVDYSFLTEFNILRLS